MIFPESGISDARVNDRYVNPFTGNLYACVRAGAADVAKWAYIGNIKGPKGDQGEKGDAGKIEVSDTEPEEKTEGMLWKHTGTLEGLIQNATYRWDGSAWQLYKFVAENIEVDQLSAITADLGIVNAGQINGVEINGSVFNNPFHSNRYYLDSAGKWQLTRTVDGTASLKDGTLTFSGIAHESGHDYKTVVSYGDDKTLIQMYDGAGADANLISETRIVEGVPYIRKEDGTYYSLFDNYVTCSGAVMNSDVTIKPRGSAGDNGHLKFPSGNNGLTGYIGSCNNTLRMYGFNSSGTYKDAYLQLTDGSFYVTGGIKAKGGDVTNSSGQTLGGAHYRLPKFYSKSGTNVSLANGSFSNVAVYNVPSNGYALVSLGGLFSGMGTSSVVRRIAGLLLNGAEYMNFETTTGSTARLWSSGCIAIPVSKGNTITGRFYQNSGAAKTLEQWKFSVIFFPN